MRLGIAAVSVDPETFLEATSGPLHCCLMSWTAQRPGVGPDSGDSGPTPLDIYPYKVKFSLREWQFHVLLAQP